MVIPGERSSPRKRKRRGLDRGEEMVGEEEREDVVERDKLPSDLEEGGGVELDDVTFQRVSGCGLFG